MASAHRKAGSQFYYAFYRDHTGRLRSKSTKQINLAKARKIAEHWESIAQRKLRASEVREATNEVIKKFYPEVPFATVGTFVENWFRLKKPELAESTLASYRKSADKFLAFLREAANADIAAVKKHQIAGFRNHLLEKVSPQTCNVDLKCIKAIFASAKKDGYVTESPAEGVDLIRRIATRARRSFSVPELRQVIEVADPEWQSMIRFGLYTGQRLNDLARLTWSAIDLDRGIIRFSVKKTRRVIVIPIAPALRSHIENLDWSGISDDVHPRLSQKPSNQLSTEFIELLIRAGLRPFRPHVKTGARHDVARKPSELSFHSLRVTATSLLKDAGVPQAVVEELIGHSSAEMSKVYTRVGIEALSRATAALPTV